MEDVNRFLGSVGYCHVRGTAIQIQIIHWDDIRLPTKSCDWEEKKSCDWKEKNILQYCLRGDVAKIDVVHTEFRHRWGSVEILSLLDLF